MRAAGLSLGVFFACACGPLLEEDPSLEVFGLDVTGVIQGEGRCEQLRVDVERCTGIDHLPVECSSLTETDLHNLETAFSTAGCDGVVHLLPVDGDTLAASCVLFGDGCIEAKNRAPRDGGTDYPILLVNGIDVSPLFSWSDRIVDTLRAAGHDVYLAVVPPYEAPPRRAAVLWDRVQEIKNLTGKPRVNLICHSLGGLDCRYLTSPNGLWLDLDDDDVREDTIPAAVASVTTVGTAHRGTPVADQALGYLPGGDTEEAINALATALGSWLSQEDLDENIHLRESLAALSESQAIAFNDAIVNAPGVYYQSWAGFSRPQGTLVDEDAMLPAACAPSDEEEDGLRLFQGVHDRMALPLVDGYRIVSEPGEDLPVRHSDGLCPVDSARWGNFRGCVPADHMEQLGRKNLPAANVRTGVDIAWFYADIATDLATRGY